MRKTNLIKPMLDKDYLIAEEGKGIYLYDSQGKQFIDGSSGAVTANIGHGVQEVIDAMNEQAKKVSFVYRSQFSTEAAENLAKKLSDVAPGDLNWSFFVSSGSEATETAIKVAIQYWEEVGKKNKKNVISRWMSYHGMTMGALSVSGHVERRKGFNQWLQESPAVTAPYYYREDDSITEEECNDMYADELEKEILRIGKDNVAAFIAEPIVGAAGGALTPSGDYYVKIKKVCEKHDILFIADEVMTGAGRTGKMFAMEHFNVIPDMMVAGKGLGAGYTPIAAAIISDKIIDAILGGSKSVLGGHTFSANPQSAAISLSVLNYIEKQNLVENAANMGEYLKNKLKMIAEKSGIIGEVRGKGLLLGIEFVEDKLTKESFTSINITQKIVQKAFENGLLVYPANSGTDGVSGDAVIISPPLTINQTEVDDLLKRFENALEMVEIDVAKELSVH